VIDVHTVLRLKERPLACDLDDAISHLIRDHTQNVKISGFTPKAVVLADDEAADAMEVNRLLESGIKLGEE
jgi:hypothetical protein